MSFVKSGGLLLAAFALSCLTPAHAAEPAWPDAPYSYTVVNQDLRSVLERFGENVGVRVVLSEAVKGNVQGTPPSSSARQFLDNLARAYGLDWYYDGSVLAVSTAAEETSASLPLHGMNFQQVQNKLNSQGVLDRRYAFRPGQSPDTAMVAGPPHYVTLVKSELGDTGGNPDGQLIIHEGSSTKIYRGPNMMEQ